jgi:oligopeptidase B
MRLTLIAMLIGRTLLAQAPIAKIIPHPDTTLGDVRTDNYFWLRDDRRKDTAMLAYLDAENHYTASELAHTQALQDQLFTEMKGRIKETDLSVPYADGHYWYYSRTVAGQQYPILCRKRGSVDAPEEVMLDENALGAGRGYFRVGVSRVSPDEQQLAFTVDTNGSERYLLVVKNLATGAMHADSVARVNYSLEWGDDHTLFYGRGDSANRPFQVRRHTLGTASSADATVFTEPNVLYNVGLAKTKDHRFLLIDDGGYDESTILYLDAARPAGAFRPLVPRTPGVLFPRAEHRGNEFLVMSNENAVNFKLLSLSEGKPARVVVAARDSVLLENFDVLRGAIVLYERGDAQTRIHVLGGNGDFYVALPDSISTVRPTDNYQFDTDVLRFTYTSFVSPPAVYDYDLKTRTRVLKKQTEVLGGFDPTRYATARVWATATDGKRIPISLVYRTPLLTDGTRPMLLTAYGSYGISSDPGFNSTVVSLLDRGVIYGVAHIRGGQEMGRQWYEDGRLLHKKNTFTDFVAAAEYLVANKYTSSDRLAIRGGSAGGLLMGAVVNLRPDLFKVVVADVPFVDVINTMSDSTIPLTTEEWRQWGDPRKQPWYGYMKSYSPYDNVRATAYPAMLVTAGLNDPRVGYWEPAKWVARLRATKTDQHVLLLRTNMGAGHGGASGRYDALREQAIRWAFILEQLGLAGGPQP